ncbi:MAG: hypothetical protein B7C55_04585 [Actinomycetales bacterium mxb001]|nr:MAG: hypothetical protein B7C55_04585 [Actinomycetales bacterium mxb001]
MSARLTARGVGVVVTALVLVALAFLLGYPELLGLAAGALVLLLISFFLVSGGREVDVQCSVPPRVERLADITVRLDLDADRAHRRGLRLRSHTPTGLGDRVPAVWDASGVHADVPVPTRKRGPLNLGPWLVERVDPWGLFHRTVGEADGVSLLVVPRIRPVSMASLPSALSEFGGSSEMGTTTFAMLREYVIGDELRHVHWKSSAKTGTLMMRQYIDVTRPRLMLVLVVEARAYTSEDEFESTVDFIASLATVAASSGLDVEVCTTSGERAAHGTGRSSAAIDMLALVERGSSGVDTRLLRANRGTTIVVRGHDAMGWWDRIPAMAVLRP